jgi:putative transposase
VSRCGPRFGLGRENTPISREVRSLRRIEPATLRPELSWSQFLRAQASAIIACDFLSVDSVWLRRLYVLFFIELANRRVHFGDVTANPGECWVIQQARTR